MPGVVIDNLTKVFAGGVQALDRLSLEVESGELVVVVGPSGCGKTTLLRLIAGLEQPTEGEITVDGQSILARPPHLRDVAMVFQEDALFPHRSVAGNIDFAQSQRFASRSAAADAKAVAIEATGIGNLLERRPHELSGGQRQRVALARAIARRPKLMLLDEPLSSLDAPARLELQEMLLRLHRELDLTMLFVTHDQEEAMALADRIAVVSRGILEQFGTPREVLENPVSRFVAELIGKPAMNLMGGTVADGQLRVSGTGAILQSAIGLPEDRVIIGIRPHHLQLGESEIALGSGVVQSIAIGSLGSLVTVVVDGTKVVVVDRDNAFAVGQTVAIACRRCDIMLFAADEAGKRIA